MFPSFGWDLNKLSPRTTSTSTPREPILEKLDIANKENIDHTVPKVEKTRATLPIYSLEVQIDTNRPHVEFSFVDPVRPILTWKVLYKHNEDETASVSITPDLNESAPKAHVMIVVREPQRHHEEVEFCLSHPDAPETHFGDTEFGWFGGFSGQTLYARDVHKDKGNWLLRVDVMEFVVRYVACNSSDTAQAENLG